MNTNPIAPRPEDILNTCQVIRNHWTTAKLREREQRAKAKQRQLVRWLAAAQASCQHAV